MCGLCGELRFDAQVGDLDQLGRMLKQLSRRGPDDMGQFQQEGLMLGHRRLSIIDLSPQGHQPMQDTGLGLVIVFNGTIYNYKTLREELMSLGYSFFSHSDTEVILKAYHAWGEDCLQRFEGMFAFAIWNTREKYLFLARDRMGIKPLYYVLDDNKIRFASNIQALLAAGGVSSEIDPVGLHHQLILHAVIPAPRTILKDVRKLEPGHHLRLSAKRDIEKKRYWQLNAQRPEPIPTEAEWLERLHESLRQAVRKRSLAADVPVGVLLSGGLDSSLLVALLAETGTEKIHTFSVGFDDQPEEAGNEFEFSDQVAAHYQTDHHRYKIPNDQVLKRLPEAVAAMAEPMVGQDAVAFYLLGEQVSQSVKVVQSGQGADEVFAGYFWYPQMHEAKEFAPFYFDRDHDEFLEAVNPAFHGGDHSRLLADQALSAAGADEYLDQVLRFDVTTLIVDDPVKRVDNMTMAWGLEARVPFLDHHVVELAAQMPPELKLRERGKYPLKAIARDLLPHSVIDRPKAYFPVPALKYVRGEFLDFMRETLLSDTARQRGLFQPAYIDKLLKNPEQHMTRLQGSKLWHSALLETWLQTHRL